MSAGRYVGAGEASDCMVYKTRNLELHSSLDRQPMKLSQHRSDVVTARRRMLESRRAAAFCTDCTFLGRFSGTP